LRSQILGLNPADAGLEPGHSASEPWGFVTETGYPNGVATLVCLRDGTTSLYTSSEFGIIGGGAHEAVVQANREVFAELSPRLSELAPSNDTTLPSVGQTVLRALTFEGRTVHSAPENDLGEGRDRLSPVFHAAHGVITQLRLIDESRR
jgi:hypothetical protein